MLLSPETLVSSIARSLYALGQPTVAGRVLETVQSPSEATTLLKARINFAQGHHASVIDLFLAVGPETPDDTRMLGISLARQGRWTEALPILEHARNQGLTGGELLCEITDAYGCLGLYEEAEETLKDLQAIPGFEPQAYYRQGTLKREQGDYDAFISEWTKLLEIPNVEHKLALNWLRVRLELAEVCTGRGLYTEARTVLAPVVATGRKYYLEGLIDYGLGQVDKAKVKWQKAIDIEPDVVPPRFELSRQLLAEGNPDAALSIMSPVEDRRDSLGADACNLLQMIYTSLNKPDVATTWSHYRDNAQERRTRLNTLSRLSTAADSITAKVIRAWKFAAAGNPSQAIVILEPVRKVIEEDKTNSSRAQFVNRLFDAIEKQQTLPDLMEFIDSGTDQTAGKLPD
ncbi:MAG: tetratricopeptide repeat protein [Planctomycetaceae bacterium]|nr:tetratricopeptide repeat protein [Planctomycetaceae bacterium]